MPVFGISCNKKNSDTGMPCVAAASQLKFLTALTRVADYIIQIDEQLGLKFDIAGGVALILLE